MKIPYAAARDLLRAAGSAALGSHSLEVAGYPSVSLLPFGLDEACRPVFVLSSLAEHTRNVLADSRVSLLVSGGGEGETLAQARLTLFGRLAPVQLSAAARARQLRYHPEWEDYLALGDFRFFRLAPERARYIAGFGRMGWLDAEPPPAVLDPDAEQRLVAALAPLLPVGGALLGLDHEGLDVRLGGVPRRFLLPAHAPGEEALREVAIACLKAWANPPPTGCTGLA